jgi:eukaryotic-like serine/threonine-protein kinase
VSEATSAFAHSASASTLTMTESTIAHYNLLEPMGHGSLGEVYRARDTRVGRTVALKILPSSVVDHPARLSSVLEEAGIAASLSHPNIATLFDVGEAGGRYYLAYEFAAGTGLREEMAGGAMNPRRALDLAMQLADAIADAHAHGIIHGDLRPGTIMVTAKGSAKILDFGLTRWTRGGLVRARAALDPDVLPADAISVVAYLSPEQALGSTVDGRTDVFSLGTLTYEMITGRNPFAAATPSDTIVNVIQGKVLRASVASSGVPKEIDETLVRALARDLSKRQQSAASLAAELRSVAAMLDVRTGDAAERSVLMPLDERPDQQASRLLFAALALAAVAAALVWWLLSHH